MVYADNTKGVVSLTLKKDEKLKVNDFIYKLLTDGYWVHMLQAKDDKVIIEIKEG